MTIYSTQKNLVALVPEIESSPNSMIVSCLKLPENLGRKGEGGLRFKGKYKASTTEKPLVSVITVVFNGAAFLEETMRSVLNQTYDNVEYIVVDGGSVDGTVDVIRKYEDVIDYWVSEPDEGIYPAMNKGVSLATGAWLSFMNAGDSFYESKAISSLNVKDHSSARLILCEAMVQYAGGIERKKKPRVQSHMMPICHQAMLFRRELLIQKGFDVSLKFAADYELWRREYSHRESEILVSESVLCNYDMNGVSAEKFEVVLGEYLKVIWRHGPAYTKLIDSAFVCVAYLRCKLLKVIRKLHLYNLYLRVLRYMGSSKDTSEA